MKIGIFIGLCAFAGSLVVGCSGGSGSTTGLGVSSDDDGGSAISMGASDAGSAPSDTAADTGTTAKAPSDSGSPGTSASSDGGAPQDDPEIDYSRTKTITMDSFTVPPNGEVYYCQTFANPWGGQVDIKTYSLDMSAGSHHMFAFYDNGASNGAVAQCANGGLTFGAFTFTAQSHTVTQTYPTTVGATLPKTTGFNMMVHYLNTGTSTISSHVALTMYVAKPSVVTQHAGVIFLNNLAITAPPGTSTATSSYTLPQNVTILASASHMHREATNFVATTSTGQTLFTTTDWAEPPAKTYSPPLNLSSGTKITWSCTYDNTSGSTMTFGESANTNVMCISTSIFYPVSDVTNPVLGSSISGIF